MDKVIIFWVKKMCELLKKYYLLKKEFAP
jgi:hypothetical protein